MPQQTFSNYISYLKKGDEFLKSQKSIIEKYMKVLPENFIESVDDLINKDVRQEELKKTTPQATASLEKEVSKTFSEYSSKVKIVKGILETKGKKEVAKSLRPPSSARTLDSKLNWLESFKAFIEQNKNDLQGFPQLNPIDVTNSITNLSQKKRERDAMENEKIQTTKYIQENYPKMVKRMAEWLKLLEVLLNFEGKSELIKQIPRQPAKAKKKYL